MKKLYVALLTIILSSSVYANSPHNLFKTAQYIFGINLHGIIHIGAFYGGEKDFYKTLNIENVLWIEADPDTYKKLLENVKPNGTTCIAENFAVTNENGIAKFHRTNNGQSSSLLELNLHKVIHPDVLFKETIEVTQKRLDTYFQESQYDVKKYNVILIDVQGAELLALQGAVNTLKTIDCIIAEVNYAELYTNGTNIWDLDKILADQGFLRIDTVSATCGWGDALYIKRNLLLKHSDSVK